MIFVTCNTVLIDVASFFTKGITREDNLPAKEWVTAGAWGEAVRYLPCVRDDRGWPPTTHLATWVRLGQGAGPKCTGILLQPQRLPAGQSLQGTNMNSISLSQWTWGAPWFQTYWRELRIVQPPQTQSSLPGLWQHYQELCSQEKCYTNLGWNKGMTSYSNF